MRSVIRLAAGASLYATMIFGPLVVQANPLPRTAIAKATVDLNNSDYVAAVLALNAAVKEDPANPGLHFLLGLAYHLQFLHGHQGDGALAEVGYQTALRFEPHFTQAEMQLGRLYLDLRDPSRAQTAFARVVDGQPGNAEALFGFAVSSLLSGNRDGADAAIRRIDAIGKDAPPLLHRLKAVIAASDGRSEDAFSELGLYSASVDRPSDILKLKRRLEHILAVTANPGAKLAEQPINGAQPAAKSGASAADPSIIGAALGATSAARGDTVGRPGSNHHWFDCDTNPGFDAGARRMGLNVNMPTPDDYISPTLPSPCGGVAPRMALLEATLFLSETSDNNSRGINLLDGLTAFYGGAVTSTQNQISGAGAGNVYAAGSSHILQQVYGLGPGLSNGQLALMTYSLNVANAAHNKNILTSHPTITAIDRLPSTLFSGQILSVGVAAGVQGSGALVDRFIGTGLSVTPTFINDNKIILSIRYSQAKFEDIPQGYDLLSNSLSVGRDIYYVNVVLNMGESVILGGIEEKSTLRKSSSTPGLKYFPIVGGLFSQGTDNEERDKQYLLITFRRSPGGSADVVSDPEKPYIIDASTRSPPGYLDFMRGDAILPPMDGLLLTDLIGDGRESAQE